MMKFLKGIYLLFGFLIIIFNTYLPEAGAQFFFMENPLLGKQVPDFTLQTVASGEVRMSQFRDGKSAIIFFWATWCPHCQRQLGILNKQKDDLKGKGIQVILVDVGEGAKQVRSFLEKNDIQFEVFLDQDSSLSEEYGLIGVPTFYFINKEGIILAVEHELGDHYEEILLGKESGNE